jgi:hypothetical protein
MESFSKRERERRKRDRRTQKEIRRRERSVAAGRATETVNAPPRAQDPKAVASERAANEGPPR